MSKTTIEWTEHSWNPVTGCTKISPGCKNCYAERRARILAGKAGYPEIPHHFDVTLRPDRLDIPLRRRKPTMYFVPSMGDLFHPDVPFKFIWEVWKIIRACPQHTFQVLTKRPERMMNNTFFFYRDEDKPLPNVWGGVSIENQDYLSRTTHLLNPHYLAVRFVSLEPLLGPIDFHPRLLEDLDWVIVGGESGPGARPMHPDWVRSIRDQCVAVGVPFFFKQWGSAKPDVLEARRWLDAGWDPDQYRHGRLLDGREWNEMPQCQAPGLVPQ